MKCSNKILIKTMGIMLLWICEGTKLLYSDMLTQNLDTKAEKIQIRSSLNPNPSDLKITVAFERSRM
jgi:hypothetical protein